MSLRILYHPESEYSTQVEGFAREFNRRYDQTVELVSLETQEGASLASLYDILDYPAVLATRDEDHKLLMAWQGSTLPLIDEVAGYVRS